MPLWTAINHVGLKSLIPVEVNSTAMTDGQETMAVALPPSPYHKAIDLIWFVKFAGNPSSAVDFQLQIALAQVDAEFFTIGSTMTNSETVGGQVIVADVVALFARVIATDAANEVPTISIMCM